MMKCFLVQTDLDHHGRVSKWGWSAGSHIRQGLDHLDHLYHPLKLSSAKRIRGMYVYLYLYIYIDLCEKGGTPGPEPAKPYPILATGAQRGWSVDRLTWSKLRIRAISAYFLGNSQTYIHKDARGLRTYHEARNIQTITWRCPNDFTK